MTNEEFFRAEMSFECSIELFKSQCENFGLNPAERIDDLLLKQGMDLNVFNRKRTTQ